MAIEYKSYLQQLAEAGRRESEPGDDKSAIEHVLAYLEAHEESERDLLGSYRYAARLGPDSGVRFLMGLILEDEERHQRLMSAMARDVKSSLLWLDDRLPLPDIENKPDAHDRLVLQTERFLDVERENAEQLKELKKEVRRLRSGLLELIVDGMEADTRKHIGILKYIHKQLEGR
jgi:rubrerythrin